MWTTIWGIVVLLTTVFFTIISVKILYLGISELKEIFNNLKK